MRSALLFLLLAPALAAQSGIEPPVLGHVRDHDGRLLRLTGTPGALTAVEIDPAQPGVIEQLVPGWELLPLEEGPLRLRNLADGAVWAVPAAEAALRLFVRVTPDIEEAVPAGGYDFPPTALGEEVELRFRIRNSGTAAATITKLALSGSGFLITEYFPMPRVIAPGFFADFHVRYRPVQNGPHRATLQINDFLFELRGDARAYPIPEVLDSGAWVALSPYRTQELGTVERGGRLDRPLRVRLPDGVSPLAEPPSISGDGFRLVVDGIDYLIRFEPAAAGAHDATLTVATRQYPLRASATNYAPPRPILSIRGTTLESGRQESLTIRFAEPARVAGTGVIRLEFTPDTPDLPDDPAVAFLPAQNRSATFTVKEGALEAEFNGARELLLQTGGTAGAIVLRVTLGPHTEELRCLVPAAPARLESSRAARGSNLLEINLRGIDNTRAATKLIFRFYLRSGASVAPGAMEVDVAAAFRDYFTQNAAIGGNFALRAQFLVSGAIGELDAVEVTVTNRAGQAETGRLRFE